MCRWPIAAIKYLSPAKQKIARAEQVLTALYAHLERGAEVTGGDVDGALRLSLAAARFWAAIGRRLPASQTAKRRIKQWQ